MMTAISRKIWDSKYRYRDGDVIHDATIEDTWRRVAHALAAVETADREAWERRFYDALADFKFLPGGRILAGAGTAHDATLFNCFVMGTIEDSMDGIFDALKEGALTMQKGGGVGYDFSTLRPRGTPARHTGTVASGPVSFMQIWDAMCATLLSTGARRGAMMATLRCDHPDIEEFIDVKRDPAMLRRFNLSVLVSDDFVKAVRADRDWALVFPAESGGEAGEHVLRRWAGDEPVPCRVCRRVGARDLWERLMRATYDYAEPGVLFVDRINSTNNLWYREHISVTNPCGELPLPAYGACDLGSVNLTAFVRDPFSPAARLDLDAIAGIVATATRLMDNVIDLSPFPLRRQAEQARGARRIGLGITGLADTLIMLGHGYGDPAGRERAATAIRTIRDSAYRASVALAREKGAFPFLDRKQYLAGEFVRRLPEDIRAAISRDGIRNSHLTAVAPTGTISLLANNISSGLEPVYDFCYTRKLREPDGRHSEHALTDYAFSLWRLAGKTELPPTFVTAAQLNPTAHLAMQAALQPFVDSSISKTINVPREFAFGDFKNIYEQAYDQGLKGCTTFRPNPVTGTVLAATGEAAASHCCNLDREGE
jgi:ribonucleoside-diphosphate reductase alpha chain